MAKKTYRPKAGAEGVKIDFPNPAGENVSIKSWPYSTDDGYEQDFLDRHPLVTDAPAPKESNSSGKSTGKKKGGSK